jgi:hypothetical protein
MELAGYAVVSDTKALAFDTDWQHEDVDNYLRELLPLPFGYMDANVSHQASKTSTEKAKLAWVLLNKE